MPEPRPDTNAPTPDVLLTSEADALFVVDGDSATPTELATGPWSPHGCHGGPVSAFMARLCEIGADVAFSGWHVSRITIELERPVVPLATYRTTVTMERPGRKVALVGAALTDPASGQVVCRARAALIRLADLALPDESLALEPAFLGPEHGAAPTGPWSGGYVAFHTHAAELRFLHDAASGERVAKLWTRLIKPVVAGEEPSGIQRLCAAADFGNGVSGGLSDPYTFINPDLTVHVLRPFVGEWVGLESRSFYSDSGVGMAESALYDSRARIGRSVQSLILQRRDQR